MNITGNTILITGGGSGIGRALAEALHAKCNQIIITGRRREALEQTVAANPGMICETLDMMDADVIRDFAARVTSDHPALNVVVQNAGIMKAEDLRSDPLDLDTVEATIMTNLLGPIRLTAALLPHLRKQASATIMTVSSGLAFTPLAATPTYNATKAAIHSWSQSLRHQLGDTAIEVLELVPPAVATDLMPGHADNPNAMPLDDFIAEVMALIEADEMPRGEILVDRVKPLRFSERDGFEAMFNRLNASH